MITDQFDEMLDQSARQPLVCPSRSTPSCSAARTASAAAPGAPAHPGHGDRVWITRPRDICAHIESLPAGTVPG